MYLSGNENCWGKVSEENSNEKKWKMNAKCSKKTADASSLWGNGSRTVNPYENMAHNTTKVSKDMGSAKEMLGMRYLCANIVKCLREKENIVSHAVNFVARFSCRKLGLKHTPLLNRHWLTVL